MDEIDDISNAPILAAGGIVFGAGDVPTVAIVHRPKYDDWVLPKGKLKHGEHLAAAAIREVVEETGCDVSVQEYLGAFAYQAAGNQKSVHMWRMEALAPRSALETDVNQALWLPLDGAADKLTYPLERQFLLAVLERNSTSRGYVRRLCDFVGKHLDSSNARLRQALSTYEVELARTIAADPSSDRDKWSNAGLTLLARARQAVNQGDPETGWQCLKAATRTELYGLGDEGRRLKAICIKSEGEKKLGGWRRRALIEIFPGEDEPPKNWEAGEVAMAASLLHDNEDNDYKQLRMRRRQFWILGICLGAFLLLAANFPPSDGRSIQLFKPSDVLYIAALGALGAAVSGILRVGEAKKGRIPEELSSFAVLIARLAVGAAAAVFLVALWVSGFLNLKEIAPGEFVIAVAFAAGFSERLAQNAIDRLAGAGGQKENK